MSMRILIVDTDATFFRQAVETLESRGHGVVVEPDADQTVARALRWKPDVVMVDANSPGVADGDLLGELGRLHPRPAVVLTAALDQFAAAWRAWQHGGDEVLIKPLLRPSEVHVAVASAVAHSVVGRRRVAVAAAPLARSA